ncbi:MAG: FkbM family methyltransferase, partial [Deltaproteobacteria bacterium]|nr:FkbM family methyltransferase [Deltaproteobacteria bacterium]
MIQLNKNTSRKDNLIFDVGLHKGEDTEFYLKKGFEVIAFEADPDLIEENKKKFSVEIIEKKLIIIEGAIVEDPSTQKVKFYKNLDKTTWGTVNQSWASRNEKLGTQNKLIEVNTIDFSKCIETYGIPYYIKIDIEGADLVCLKAFRQFKLKPYYLSIESEKVVFEKLIQELEILIDLGYD